MTPSDESAPIRRRSRVGVEGVGTYQQQLLGHSLKSVIYSSDHVQSMPSKQQWHCLSTNLKHKYTRAAYETSKLLQGITLELYLLEPSTGNERLSYAREKMTLVHLPSSFSRTVMRSSSVATSLDLEALSIKVC